MDCFACCHCCQTQTKTLPSQTSNDQKSRDRLLSQILFLPARFAILYRQRNLLTQRSTRREKEDRKAAIIFHNNRWRLRCAMNTTCTNSATRRLKNIPISKLQQTPAKLIQNHHLYQMPRCNSQGNLLEKTPMLITSLRLTHNLVPKTRPP